MGFKDDEIGAIELAVEEALVNIIKHGYNDKKGDIIIDCVENKGKGIKIELWDQGIACNPLENQRNVDLNTIIESQTVGGYGVFLMVKLMDHVGYRRERDSNVLTLIKHFSCTNDRRL